MPDPTDVVKGSVGCQGNKGNIGMTRRPLVSVLTPVYNGEVYIKECIESVLAQTYENWEYIIVNNCSTDRTLSLINEYARRDPRIRIVNNTEFVGPIKNHNIALTHISSKSKYCKFIQADDVLFATCLEEMVSLAEAHPSVGIVTSYQLRGRRVCSDGWPYSTTIVSGREVCRRFFLNRERAFGNMTAFLIRSDLVRERNPLFFNEKFSFCDTETYFIILKEHDYGFVHQVLTFDRMPENRLSSFTESHNQWTIEDLYLAMTYGHVYLSPEERRLCLQKCVKRYYRWQGRELLRFRERSFWQYHRRMMIEIGTSFSTVRLLQAAVEEIGWFLFRPMISVGNYLKHILRNGGRERQNAKG